MNFGEDLFAIPLHVLNDRARCPRLFVVSRPNQQLEDDRGQRDALLRQLVVNSPEIGRFFGRNNDTGRL